MEVSAALQSAPCLFAFSNLNAHRSKTYLSVGFDKGFGLISTYRRCHRRSDQLRRSTPVRAAASWSSNPSEDGSPIAPLQWESPVGQFLSQILVSHPHLLPAAVDQQLEQLQTDRDADMNPREPSSSGTDLILFRRIADLKANERRKALEEILYALVVGKFIDSNVPLVPGIARLANSMGRASKLEEENLERVHSPEAYEMIKNHLSLILGQRPDDSNTVMQTSKLRVGQVYAASVMYGYFLRRVDQRFQLEKKMKTLPWGSDVVEDTIKQQVMPNESGPSPQDGSSDPEVSSWSSAGFTNGGFADRVKHCKLRSYVMSFDSETLQRYASIRSKEAFSIIEKHTEALFGRPEIIITPEGTIDSSKDEQIKINCAGLRRLILEAVTFGSFLWDVESHVDSRYHFVTN